MIDLNIPRPLKEWNEDVGDVLWWKFPVDEAPYVGSPNDVGQVIEVHAHGAEKGTMISRFWVGGWPGYHTHWTPLPPAPIPPTLFRRKLVSMKRKGGDRVRAKCAGQQVLIWSGEHGAWWRKGYAGYTTHRSAAGVYGFEDAYAHSQHCDPDKQIVFEVLS